MRNRIIVPTIGTMLTLKVYYIRQADKKTKPCKIVMYAPLEH